MVVVKRVGDTTGLYEGIVERLFLDRWRKGAKTVDFHRSDIQAVATALGVALPKNLGDLIYAYRFRKALPERIAQTAPAGQEWVIELVGGSTYRFSLTQASRIRPQTSLALVDIPDATPDIVLRYALGDEQALLAKLRYNRLIDVFLGIAVFASESPAHFDSHVQRSHAD